MDAQPPGVRVEEVAIPIGGIALAGTLAVPASPSGIVLFAHGSGSSRFSPRNRFVAEVLQRAGLATLLLDLLTGEEERIDERSGHLRFDIGLLAERLVRVTDWAGQHPGPGDLALGLFGASTGAAAALVAAARRPSRVGAVVSRGGRPDLARPVLPQVRAPTLLIVGERDPSVTRVNEEARARLVNAPTRLEIVPGATHLFEEPGALETVARLAREWLLRWLAPAEEAAGPG